MQIIPVIDIKDGHAVHAVGGHREHYRPVQSVVSDSSDPVRLLSVLKRRYHIDCCYVADINGLQDRQPNRCSLAELTRVGVRLMLDIGVRGAEDIEPLLDLELDNIILGSETVPDIGMLAHLVTLFGPDRLSFSVDMREGRLISTNPAWQAMSPMDLAVLAADAGIHQFILLDLSAIGTGRGVSTIDLCRNIRQRLPNSHIIAGGGVRNMAHLSQLEDAGADGALVATAFHSGALSANDIRQFHSRSVTNRTAS